MSNACSFINAVLHSYFTIIIMGFVKTTEKSSMLLSFVMMQEWHHTHMMNDKKSTNYSIIIKRDTFRERKKWINTFENDTDARVLFPILLKSPHPLGIFHWEYNGIPIQTFCILFQVCSSFWEYFMFLCDKFLCEFVFPFSPQICNVIPKCNNEIHKAREMVKKERKGNNIILKNSIDIEH